MATKPQKTVVIAIVRGLDKGQAMFVRGRLRGQKRALYDFYTSSKNPENLLEAQEAVDLKGNAFASLKSKLEVEVLHLLAEHRDQTSPKLVAAKHVSLAKQYLLLGFEKEASRELLKALDCLEQAEDFNGAKEILNLFGCYLGDSPQLLVLERGQAINDRITEIENAISDLRAAEKIKSLVGKDKTVKASQLLEALLHSKTPQGCKARIYFLRAKVICSFVLRRLDTCLEFCGQLHTILRANALIIQDSEILRSILALVLVESTTTAMTENPLQGIQKLDEFILLLRKSGFAAPSSLKYHRLELGLHSVITADGEGDLDELLATINYLEQEASVFCPKEIVQLLFHSACALLKVGRNEDAAAWLIRFRKHRATVETNLWFALSILVEMLVTVKLQQFDDLENCSRRALRRFKKAKFPKDLAELLAFGISDIGKDPSKEREKMKQLATELIPFQQNQDLRTIFEAFNIVDWIRSNYQ